MHIDRIASYIHSHLHGVAGSYRELDSDKGREECTAPWSPASQTDKFTSCPLVFCKAITLHEKTSPLFSNLGAPIYDANVASIRMVAVAFDENELAGGWPLCLFPDRRSSPANKESVDRISCRGKLVY